MSALGFQPKSFDTTDMNLNELMDRMTSDLQRYTIAAEHWQSKLTELRAKEAERNEASKAHADGRNTSNNGGFGNEAGSAQDGPLSAWEHDMLNRLQRVSEPKLDMLALPDPRIRSCVTKGFLSSPVSERYFNRVLDNVSTLAGVFGIFQGSGGKWDAISRLKPNFSEKRARRVWYDVFAPIETSSTSFAWESAPSSRESTPHTYKYAIETASSSHSSSPDASTVNYGCYESSSLARSSPRYIDPEDSDFDHMDRRLAVLSDDAVVDMLHYCSLMIIGFNHAGPSDEKLFDEARDHLGRNCERLLRELIFTRNASCDPRSAQGLLAGMIGILRYFSAQQRTGAVLSMMEIAWQMAMNHVTEIHPIMKGLISFVSTVLAPNPSRRAVWMARNQENYQSTSERYFHLCTTAYFAAAYYALANRDEDTLLHYLAQLDDVLAPNSDPSGEAFRDPECCMPFQDVPDEEFDDPISTFDFQDPNLANSVGGNYTGPDSQGPAVHAHHQHQPSCPNYAIAPSEPYSAELCDQQCSQRVNRYTYPRPIWPPAGESDVTLPATAGRNFTMIIEPSGYDNYYNSQDSARSGSQDSHMGVDLPPTEAQYAYINQANMGYSDSETEELSSMPTYTPSEDFKAILRSATHLIRAEGALLSNDFTTCMQWVDEAEKEVISVPDVYLDHKVFIVDVSALKNVFVSECPFPAGSRTIAAEFERRLEEETKRRQKRNIQLQRLQESIIH